jgi:hypothetical protein
VSNEKSSQDEGTPKANHSNDVYTATTKSRNVNSHGFKISKFSPSNQT